MFKRKRTNIPNSQKGHCRVSCGALSRYLVVLIALSPLGTKASYAASDEDMDKLTTYATVIGRAIACGADVTSAMHRIGSWMDVKFPPGSKDQKMYLPVFMAGVKYHAEQQHNGESPDSCAEVLRVFADFPWP